MSIFVNKKALSMSKLIYVLEKQKALYILILFISLLTIYYAIITTNVQKTGPWNK